MTITRSDNIPPEQNIHIEILLPELTAVAIPDHNSGTISLLQIEVRITTSNNQDFQVLNLDTALIPELVTSNNKSLQGHVIAGETVLYTQPYEPILQFLDRHLSQLTSWRERPYRQYYKSKEQLKSYSCSNPATFSFLAKLYWHESRLTLQIPTTPDYVWGQRYGLPLANCFWTFTGLEAGNYQLRFSYNSVPQDSFTTSLTLAESATIESIRVAQITSSSVNLQFIQSTGSDGSIVDVNGVCFETFLPQKVLRFPRRDIRQKLRIRHLLFPNIYPLPFVPVQIGLRITNNTSIPLSFNSGGTLLPELLGVDGLLRYSGGSYGTKAVTSSTFPVAHPGEGLTFFQDIGLFWRWGNEFGLKINANDGSHWVCEPIKVGTYQIQFTYNTQDSVQAWQSLRHTTVNDADVEETLWIGQVITSPITLELIPS